MLLVRLSSIWFGAKNYIWRHGKIKKSLGILSKILYYFLCPKNVPIPPDQNYKNPKTKMCWFVLRPKLPSTPKPYATTVNNK